MTQIKESFDTESQLNSYMDEKYELTLDLDTSSGGDINFDLIETPDSIIVGYLAQDSDVQDYFEDDDGAGTFIEFSNPGQRDEKMAELSKTKKLFYLVDKYDHGSVHYSVAESKTYPDQRWDVSQGKAVLIPCDDVQSQYRKYKKEHGEAEAFKHFIKDSNNVLDTYSSWCNGDTYGYKIFVFDKKGILKSEDACWGFIGDSYADKEKTRTMNYLVQQEQVDIVAKDVMIEDLKKEDIKNLPFKIMKKGYESGKVAKVFDDIIVCATYEGEDNSVVYNWNPSMEKPTAAKFGQWLKSHGTTPEQFLTARMTSDINESIRKKLTNTEQLKDKSKLTM